MRRGKGLEQHNYHGVHPSDDEHGHEHGHHDHHESYSIVFLVIMTLGFLAAIAGIVVASISFVKTKNLTECKINPDCSDGNTCTIDSCINNVCVHSYATNGCDEVNKCNQTSTCIDCVCVETCFENCTQTPCMVSTCQDGACVDLYQIPGCCDSNAFTCEISNDCYRGICNNGSCFYIAVDEDSDNIPCPADCDDNNTNIGYPLAHYPDYDGDGYGENTVPTYFCDPIEKTVTIPYSTLNGDCDDTDSKIFPGSFTYDQCQLVEILQPTDLLVSYNLADTIDFKILKVVMTANYTFVSWLLFDQIDVNTTLIGNVSITVLVRNNDLTGGWVANQVFNVTTVFAADEAAPDICTNSYGLDMAAQNNTLVVSRCAGDNTTVACADIYRADDTGHFTLYTTLCGTGNLALLNHNRHHDDKNKPRGARKQKFLTDIAYTDQPPYSSPIIVRIDQDLVIIARSGDWSSCSGLVFVFRDDNPMSNNNVGIATYTLEAVITAPALDCMTSVNVFTFPTDIAVRNQSVFISAPGSISLNQCSETTPVNGIIYWYQANWTSPTQKIAPEVNSLDLGGGYLGTPHIEVNENMLLVSSISFLPSDNTKTGLLSYTMGSNLQYSSEQYFKPSFGVANDGANVQDFGGPFLSYQVELWSLENNTIVGYSTHGLCNNFQMVTKPGQDWIFGPELPTINNFFMAPGSSPPSMCNQMGLDSTPNSQVNFRGIMDTNLLYEMLEVGLVFNTQQATLHRNDLLDHSTVGALDGSINLLAIVNCDKNTLC
jgi:hypothetical protein